MSAMGILWLAILSLSGFDWRTFTVPGRGASRVDLPGSDDSIHVAFNLLGAAMLLSPVWVWWLARRTVYAITDRRAIVIEEPSFRRTVYCYSGERLAAFVRRDGRRGRGDIIFEQKRITRPNELFPRDLSIYNSSTRSRPIGFLGVADVKQVEQFLRELIACSGTPEW